MKLHEFLNESILTSDIIKNKIIDKFNLKSNDKIKRLSKKKVGSNVERVFSTSKGNVVVLSDKDDVNIVSIELSQIDVINDIEKDKVTSVKYSNIEYIDSTEKIIVSGVYPINGILVLDNLSSKQYYTLRNKQDVNISIISKEYYDFFDFIEQLDENISTPSTYSYKLEIPEVSWSNKLPDSNKKLF